MRIRPLPRCISNRKSQHGSAILIILTIIGIGAAFLLVSALNKASNQTARDKITTAALAQAKEALIGFAATYRDTHANEVFGYLPLPDSGPVNNLEGEAAGSITGSLADYSLIGKLPWKTLGLSALRDSGGECLWYAISGRYKNSPMTTALNWDTLGQFDITAEDGTTVTLPNTVAIVFSPGPVLPSQVRSSLAAGVANCGGNYDVRNYLDTYIATNAINNILNYFPGSTNNALAANTNNKAITTQSNPINYNDRFLTISADDIFRRVKMRSDFKSDIDSMLGDLANCLNNLQLPLPGLPTPNGSKGIGSNLESPSNCLPPSPGTQKGKVYINWKDNLLYAKPATSATVNSTTGCNAVLLFGGERTASQSRATAAEKLAAANYLEGTNAALFPASGTYTGATHFSSASASADVARCIKGLPAGATQKSFASDFAGFATAGVGVTTNATDKTVTVADAAGSSGGCFWFPSTIPLAGKVLRAYYDYQFSTADTYALTGTGTDRGNGFTFQMVRNDIGAPTSVCGREANMGALAIGASPGDMWGTLSFIIETDVHKDAGDADPNENHTAIMAHGNLDHSLTNGNPTAACNGTAAGCRHSPANKFEESSPLSHNQRIEIHTGCNAGCSSCDPANHAAPNTYARITAWVDCTDCDDTVVDLDRAAKTPTINRCIILDTPLNSVYFGFTGGFRSGTAAQGVIIRNFHLRSE